MHTNRWTALGVAATLIALGAAACTDPTVAPTSTVTGANYYNDPGSYQAFLAKVYAGLAVGGQNGGDGSTDIQGIDGGFSQYMRLYWELEELPTDEAVIAWGDQTLPELNTQGWNPSNTFVNAMYYRVYFQIGMANELLRQTTDAVLAGRGVTAQLKTTIHTYRAEARFLRALSGELQRVDLADEDWARAVELIERYADLGLGLVDASVVAVAERLGVTDIATLDRRDFAVVRPRHVVAFTLLP